MTAKPNAPTNAIAMLTAEHREVEELFDQYEKLTDRAKVKKKKLADQICTALILHTTIEEEIFYPAMREAVNEAADKLDEAVVEHAAAKDLIQQIQQMDPDEDLYDAKVKVLSEEVQHHVKEEEKELFPMAKKSDMDMAELGQQMQSRKQELAASM